MDPADSHPAALPIDLLRRQCEVRFTRRSGPGGQNRNKVETAVVLRHQQTGIGAEASERRTQGENLAAALLRLRLNLALQIRHPVSPTDPPSALWVSRCRGGKLNINPGHDHFPGILAEALDRLSICDLDPKAAAACLGCSTSQLIKLLKLEPRALGQVNLGREKRSLHPLQ